MTSPDPAEQHLLTTAAELLDLGQGIERLSRALTVLAVAGLLAPIAWPVGKASTAALLLATVAGLGSALAAARVAFDAGLFRQLASARGDLAMLDGSLTQLGLLPPSKVGRPLAPRLAGAKRLLARQAALLALQVVALAAAGIAAE